MKIAVVGAGIMGRVLALSLVNAGYEVSLFDQSSARAGSNCSYVAAGMLSAIAELEKADHCVYQLGKESIQQHWPKMLKQLNKPLYFSQKGSLLLAHPQDRSELIRYMGVIESKLQDQAPFKLIDNAQLTELEPDLGKFKEAYYFPEEAQMDSQAVMDALAGFFQERGVHFYENTRVSEIQAHSLSVGGVRQDFDWIMDCRGLAAKETFSSLRGVRGELIWLHAPQVVLQHPVRLLHPRYALYVVPRPDEQYIIGASEIESEDNGPISVRTSLELLSAAYYIHPGFAEARVLKTATQSRPTLPDHLPSIKIKKGLLAINGLYRHGFLIAPSLAEEVLRYLESGVSGLYYSNLWESVSD